MTEQFYCRVHSIAVLELTDITADKVSQLHQIYRRSKFQFNEFFEDFTSVLKNNNDQLSTKLSILNINLMHEIGLLKKIWQSGLP